MLGASGGMLPHIFFTKKIVQFGAIWCILGPILASITLLFLRLFYKKNVAFADKSENKEKKNLKCDLMVLKAVLTSAGTLLIPFWLQRKKFQLDLNTIPECE